MWNLNSNKNDVDAATSFITMVSSRFQSSIEYWYSMASLEERASETIQYTRGNQTTWHLGANTIRGYWTQQTLWNGIGNLRERHEWVFRSRMGRVPKHVSYSKLRKFWTGCSARTAENQTLLGNVPSNWDWRDQGWVTSVKNRWVHVSSIHLIGCLRAVVNVVMRLLLLLQWKVRRKIWQAICEIFPHSKFLIAQAHMATSDVWAEASLHPMNLQEITAFYMILTTHTQERYVKLYA